MTKEDEHDEDREKSRLAVFEGDKIKYPLWKQKFKIYLKSKGCACILAKDMTTNLPTETEFADGEVVSVAADGAVAKATLDDKIKKLHEDDATVVSKLSRHISDDLCGAMMTAGGDLQSAWKMFEWLDANCSEVKAADSLQDLLEELKNLEPSSFDVAALHLAKLDDINDRLKKVDSTGVCALDELRLKIEVLTKLPDVSEKNKSEKWAMFQSECRKADVKSKTSWADFKEHLSTFGGSSHQ